MKYFIILLILFIQSLHAEVKIMIAPTCKLETLTTHEVKHLFMIKKKSINNESITVLDNSDKEIYKEFLKKYLKKSPRKMKVYWVRMLFTGKKVAPKKFSLDMNTTDNCYVSYFEETEKPSDWKVIEIK